MQKKQPQYSSDKSLRSSVSHSSLKKPTPPPQLGQKLSKFESQSSLNSPKNGIPIFNHQKLPSTGSKLNLQQNTGSNKKLGFHKASYSTSNKSTFASTSQGSHLGLNQSDMKHVRQESQPVELASSKPLYSHSIHNKENVASENLSTCYIANSSQRQRKPLEKNYSVSNAELFKNGPKNYQFSQSAYSSSSFRKVEESSLDKSSQLDASTLITNPGLTGAPKAGPKQTRMKESFAESENFGNIEEKKAEDMVISCRNVMQMSLNNLIKERFLGPMVDSHGGNTGSFMKRNVLATNSNRSSVSSCKSSFLTKANDRLATHEHELHQDPTHDALHDAINDMEESMNEVHCCENINSYSIVPKSVFQDLWRGLGTKEGKQEKARSNFGEYITKMERSSVRKSPFARRRDQSLNESSQDTMRNSCFFQQQSVEVLEQEVKPVESEEESKGSSSKIYETVHTEQPQQEDIIEFLQSDTHKLHLIQTLQSLQYVKNNLLPIPVDLINSKQVRLPPFRNPKIAKTIIFDLDETLVHCIEDFKECQVDKVINVFFPNGDKATAGINIRPYAQECIRKASELMQVVVFTASHQAYADVVLDLLDPKREIFEMRLYRDSCIRNQDGFYIKDLRIFQNCRELKDLIIVDNAVYSFGYQLENGIPIIPFYQDKDDEELLHLIQYLQCLVKSGDDVREHNRKAFQLRELQGLDVQTFLQNFFFENRRGSEEEEEEEGEEEESPQRRELEGVNEESNEDEDSGMDSRVENSRMRPSHEQSLQEEEEEEEESEEMSRTSVLRYEGS